MARRKVGEIKKSKNQGESDYIEIFRDIKIPDGSKKVYLQLESKKSKIEGITKALNDGKITEDYAKKQISYANEMKDYVRFEIIQVTKD